MALKIIVFNRSYVPCIFDSVVISLYVCQFVCVSVCLFPRREVISQPIFKCDISTDAHSIPLGISENKFEIKVSVQNLFRKNLIKYPFFDRFESLTHGSTCLRSSRAPVYVTLSSWVWDYFPLPHIKNLGQLQC